MLPQGLSFQISSADTITIIYHIFTFKVKFLKKVNCQTQDTSGSQGKDGVQIQIMEC